MRLVGSVSRLTCLRGKLILQFLENFSTRLLGWLVSWKRAGSASGLILIMQLLVPGSGRRFYSLSMLHTTKNIKLSITRQTGWPDNQVDFSYDQNKKTQLTYWNNLAPRSTPSIWSASKNIWKILHKISILDRLLSASFLLKLVRKSQSEYMKCMALKLGVSLGFC